MRNEGKFLKAKEKMARRGAIYDLRDEYCNLKDPTTRLLWGIFLLLVVVMVFYTEDKSLWKIGFLALFLAILNAVFWSLSKNYALRRQRIEIEEATKDKEGGR